MSRNLPDQDHLIRMQEDLKRALMKDPSEIRWSMVIDVSKCIGCHACTLGCVAENRLPPGVVYRPVMEMEIGRYPHVRRRFLPRPCVQCQNPPCVKVCPVTATYRDRQGVVVVDYNRCIGCRYCLVACPYAARTSDFGEWYTRGTPDVVGKIYGRMAAAEGYEAHPATEYGRRWPVRRSGSPIGNARKCHFCLHRLAVGMLPACVTTCIGRATFFGDKMDPESLIFSLLGSPRIFRLKEELGTKPAVYYLS
ncbi:MAG: 4Fe-4S dicluster domain-containing protein [Syntrophobacteraceae bacterium]|jgi:molybdopterin-containing oxidoreductase family iron-sulfur binding subunit|nr:4Fe-4S dicluster domain-containing protein [Syntrophobacteraceae bacterium]